MRRWAIVDQKTHVTEKNRVMHILGDVKARMWLLVDDIMCHGQFFGDAVAALKNYGVKGIYAAASHGVFPDPAKERIAKQ